MSTPNVPQQPTTPYPQASQQQPQGPGQQGQQHQQQPAYGTPGAPYQAQPSQQQAYQQAAAQQYGQQTYPAPSTATTLDKTNTFAFLTIIFAFLSPIAGIVFGHMSLGQIKRTGDAGRGIALTGLIISYSYFLFILIFVFMYVGLLVMLFGSMGAAMSSLDSY